MIQPGYMLSLRGERVCHREAILSYEPSGLLCKVDCSQPRGGGGSRSGGSGTPEIYIQVDLSSLHRKTFFISFLPWT